MRNVGPIRVIVVDDEDDMRRLFRLALDYDDRFEVVGEAADGAQAAEVAAALRPEAVVLDWRMPRVGGADAIARIRAVAPACKIVIVSAYDRVDVEEAARAAGADGYLDKPEAAEGLPAVLLGTCRGEVDLRDATRAVPRRRPGSR